MNPDLKAKLDQALNAKKTADAANAAAADARKSKSQASVTEFTRLLETVVSPALEVVLQYLLDNGVKGSLQKGRSQGNKLDPITCPTLTLRVLSEAYITVECDPSAGYARFPYSTMVNGSGMTSAFNGFPLAELTSEKVQSYAVELITEVLKAR